jgi:hypothetical protein
MVLVRIHLATGPWKATIVFLVLGSLAEDAEMEYAEGNGLIYIPRATKDAGFDYELQLASNTVKPIVSALGAPGKPLKASESATVQGCIWIPDEQAELPLEAGEVEVQVEYAGLGSSHTLNSVHHAVGVVSRRADSAKTFELGQRVVVFPTLLQGLMSDKHRPWSLHCRKASSRRRLLPSLSR